jgi:hypothetical protein
MRLGGITLLDAMKRLIGLFAARSPDRSTLDELHSMIDDRGSWKQAHGLFQRIRHKTLEAAQRRDAKLEAQFGFEEACAKTLYNLCQQPAPFDPDSPYWIIPDALVTARHFKIDEREIIAAIVA